MSETTQNKRMLQIFDEINLADTANGTENLMIGDKFISAEYLRTKSGTKVTMGIGGNQVDELLNGKKVPLLILVDIEEYNKRKQ